MIFARFEINKSMVDFEFSVTLPVRYLSPLVLYFLLLIMGITNDTLVTSVYKVKFFCLTFQVTNTSFKCLILFYVHTLSFACFEFEHCVDS